MDPFLYSLKRLVMFVLPGFLAITSIASQAQAEGCSASFGKPFSFEGCPTVRLPGLTLRFDGISQPNPAVRMSCWNYRAWDSQSAAEFKHCHTGELGGFHEVALGGRSYMVDMDVTASCVPFRFADGVVVWQKNSSLLPYEKRLANYQVRETECRKAAGLKP